MSTDVAVPLIPRPAATVMVIRPLEEKAPEGTYEVFMVRRSSKSTFVPEVFVFPGGGLEAFDSSPAALSTLVGPGSGALKQVFRDTPGLGAEAASLKLEPAEIAGLHLAALRELFEEAGVLLVQDEQGQEFEVGKNEKRRAYFHAARLALQKREFTFVELLQREKLKADIGRLIYFSHWITPASEKRRFDTRFFLTLVNFGHEAEADEHETNSGVWIEPGTALKLQAEDQFNLIYPTIMHLKRLAAHPTIPDLLEYARNKEIVAAMPEVSPGPAFQLAGEILERW